MHKITSFSCFLVLLILVGSCKNKSEEKNERSIPQATEKVNKEAKQFTENIAQTHEQKEFLNFEAVQYQLSLKLKDKEIDTRLRQATNAEKLVVRQTNGNKLFFTEEEVFATPPSFKPSQTDKQLLLWSFLFTLPQKINTYKGNWTDKKEEVLREDSLTSFKFSPKGKISKSLKNLRIYTDTKTNLVKAVSVESTSGLKPQNFTVFYEHYYTTKNIPVCSSWEIYAQPTGTNKLGEQIGKARIKNLRFLKTKNDYFSIPENAKNIAL